MDAREFGHTAVQVTPITLGSWPMSGDRYGPIDDSEAVQTIRNALGDPARVVRSTRAELPSQVEVTIPSILSSTIPRQSSVPSMTCRESLHARNG